MKLLPFLFLMGTLGAAGAAPVDDYLASRDRAIAALADSSRPGFDAKEKAARASLETKLRAVIGPVAPAGFRPIDGKINLETLSADLGFGQLDGLRFDKRNPTTKIVVTTQALLRQWIAGQNARGSDADSHVPTEIVKAVASESFYTFAISSDAAVAKFADLPVNAPGATIATVLLVQRRQDVVLSVPDELMASVVRGDVVFVAAQSLLGKVPPIPACDEIWHSHEKKRDEAMAAYNASGLKDEKQFDRATALEAQGDVAYRQCFAARFKDQAASAAALRQAQALVETLK
ncbi:MAG: hypothetical protein P4L76_16110 [Beijerinckiaceae bacterium]|nr:hypothetical protein [Beijerinckiaceae bacterium]